MYNVLFLMRSATLDKSTPLLTAQPHYKVLQKLGHKDPFRLGTEKNIACFNPAKKKLDEKYKIIKKNLDRYSGSFLKKINKT